MANFAQRLYQTISISLPIHICLQISKIHFLEDSDQILWSSIVLKHESCTIMETQEEIWSIFSDFSCILNLIFLFVLKFLSLRSDFISKIRYVQFIHAIDVLVIMHPDPIWHKDFSFLIFIPKGFPASMKVYS